MADRRVDVEDLAVGERGSPGGAAVPAQIDLEHVGPSARTAVTRATPGLPDQPEKPGTSTIASPDGCRAGVRVAARRTPSAVVSDTPRVTLDCARMSSSILTLEPGSTTPRLYCSCDRRGKLHGCRPDVDCFCWWRLRGAARPVTASARRAYRPARAVGAARYAGRRRRSARRPPRSGRRPRARPAAAYHRAVGAAARGRDRGRSGCRRCRLGPVGRGARRRQPGRGRCPAAPGRRPNQRPGPRAAANESAVSVGGLVIDEVTYSARLRGRALELTFKEFELLKFLAQHPGRVFTRAQLLQEVWGYDYYGGTRTVDVHVRRLRAKLGAEHEQLIGTVRHVGYKFVAPPAASQSHGARARLGADGEPAHANGSAHEHLPHLSALRPAR